MKYETKNPFLAALAARYQDDSVTLTRSRMMDKVTLAYFRLNNDDTQYIAVFMDFEIVAVFRGE